MKAFTTTKRGDRMELAEFAATAERHRDMVYRVALNCLGSAHDAEDAVQ